MATLEGEFVVAWKDYGGELSKTNFRVAALTAANFDAQAALKTALLNSLASILLGNLQYHEVANVIVNDIAAPDDPTAQRELAWKVDFQDPTALKAGTSQIPVPLLSSLDPNDRKHAEIGDEDVIDAFVTAFEAYVLSPAGNAVEVEEITLVGRNL